MLSMKSCLEMVAMVVLPVRRFGLLCAEF
jgi:hypothetical protein